MRNPLYDVIIGNISGVKSEISLKKFKQLLLEHRLRNRKKKRNLNH